MIFDFIHPGEKFSLFSQSHIWALGIILMLNLCIFVKRKSVRDSSLETYFRYSLSALLILQELELNVWRLAHNAWTFGESLPLHLCGVAVVLSAIMLLNKSQKLYEIVYFWGLGGAIQALLTPNLDTFSFPHYRFYQFFVSHGSIVTAALFATFIFQYRPQLKSVLRVFFITNIYMVFIAGFNWLTNGNYLFICHKPPTASVLDYFGPWPWYIVVLEGVALVSFFIYYIPFILVDIFTKNTLELVDQEQAA